MYIASPEIVTALETILPVYHERILNSGIETPCISYSERNNVTTDKGDTMQYSTIEYQIKVWANSIEVIENYASEIDNKLKRMGWTRTNCNELFDNNSTMIQKIMVYQAKAVEQF